jgi:hypothetical protein
MIVHLFGRAHCYLFRSLSRLHFNFNHYMLSPRASRRKLPECVEDKVLAGKAGESGGRTKT